MTDSPINSPSPTESATAVIACGALAVELRRVVARRGWEVEVHLLPALLHNRPAQIAPRVDALAAELATRGRRVVVAYADCGTYGALDEVCARRGLERLGGSSCYDLFAGVDAVAAILAEEPGTYLLTDFLVTTFKRTVVGELGLDRHPELWSDYFAHYRRVVWLAQARTETLEREATAIAARFGLPLEVREVGGGTLEDELEALLARVRPPVVSGA